MASEINLVPDVKGEMLKAIKMRNMTLFVCLMVVIVSIAAVVIAALVMGGQQLALDAKKSSLELMSDKLNSFSDLDDFLTIRNQVGNIDLMSSDKNVLSRTFNVLSALIPTGADTITISELNVDLSKQQPTLTFEAQANAGKEPYIDYNVLDSFKKSMQYMRYDYGNYVDKKGANIPAYCMIESGEDGATFRDGDRGVYALWTIDAEGCNPSAKDGVKSTDYSVEDYKGQDVVRIWRTPQYDEWYKKTKVEGQPYMSLEGEITGVEHFESACVTYMGNMGEGNSVPKWIESNEKCLLVPDGVDGIKVSDSSNGRGSDNELVLRFSAVITLDDEVYRFVNKHMLAIAPSGRRNVTDSYVQIQAMFGERAKDCQEDDTACATENADTDSNMNTNTNGGE